MRFAKTALFLCFLGTAVFVAEAEAAEDFHAAMEANNARWLQAYNT